MSHADAIAWARLARSHAVTAALDPSAPGMAGAGLVVAEGPDAARFLHSQLTNDVEGLQPGEGNLSARVKRTGHLQHLLSVHRHPAAENTFWLLTAAEDASRLQADLDQWLFSDDLTLTVLTQHWLTVQGPGAAAHLDRVFGPLGFEPWTSLPEHAIRSVRRAKGDLQVPAGTLAIRRSLGGDPGYLLACPTEEGRDALLTALTASMAAEGLPVLTAEQFAPVWDILRIEAGEPRLAVDMVPKPRLLPETGIEHRAVSYTKGCYLGQEVIARVRTYGSVPSLLRALLLEADAELPAPGTPLSLEPGGKAVGHAASSAFSVVRDTPVLLAYLKREHRTPGQALTLHTPSGTTLTATVQALPLHHAADDAGRVQALYDRAIRIFAKGQEDRALQLMEQCLRLDPGFSDAYEAIGVMLGRSGRFHEAIDVFRRLEEVAPDEPMVNTNLSLYFMKIGDTQTAEDEAGKATLKNMARSAGKAAEKVDEDLARSKKRDALRKQKMFAQVLEFDPDDPIALFGMGRALLTLEQPAQAAQHLRHALTVDKNNSAVYASLGRALESTDDLDEAVEVYQQGLKVASKKGDLMPLREMEHRLLLLGASRTA